MGSWCVIDRGVSLTSVSSEPPARSGFALRPHEAELHGLGGV